MSVRILLFLLLLPVAGLAQGFAGLGQGSSGFTMPDPERNLTFPADHGAHPDFRTEWWYVTAALTGADGRDYGVQWTLFRSSLAPGGPQVWMAHLGVTTPDAHVSGERLGHDETGQAGVSVAPFEAWLDDWHLVSDDNGIGDLRLEARTAEAGYDLRLRAEGPIVLHGENGYSVKSASGQASRYYSQPFYAVTGTLHLPSGPVEVTGQGWLDREWSSQFLEADQAGWDWFSLHFEDGARLMAFVLRGDEPFRYASWIAPDGTTTPYYGDALSVEPMEVAEVEGRDVPVRWRLRLPQRGLDVTVAAVNAQSWQDTLFPYWEGPVRAEGSHPGRGYLEMTGYE